MMPRRVRRHHTVRVLLVARQSAALLRGLAPNRRTVSDLVDEIWCNACERWLPAREFARSATTCTACAITAAAQERGWSR